jgi:hypothetical protein
VLSQVDNGERHEGRVAEADEGVALTDSGHGEGNQHRDGNVHRGHGGNVIRLECQGGAGAFIGAIASWDAGERKRKNSLRYTGYGIRLNQPGRRCWKEQKTEQSEAEAARGGHVLTPKV